MKGHSNLPISTSVKWDGAPAIFAGIDPEDGKFFVAKKGLFNVTPKIYKTQGEIHADLQGDLQRKFSVALEEFRDIGITSGVIQGDLMYTKSDITPKLIDGENYITFHPNTIVYAVPKSKTELYDKIMESNIGVVWHTTYNGTSLKSMAATFNQPIIHRLKHHKGVWMNDATYRDVTGNVNFTSAELMKFREIMSRVGSMLNTIPREVYDLFAKNRDLTIRLHAYNNSKIRAGTKIINVPQHAKGWLDYFEAYYEKEELSRKTPAGKLKITQERDKYLIPMKKNQKHIVSLFMVFEKFIEAKLMVLDKMHKAASLGTFLKTKDGYKVTTPEGYVVSDHLNNSTVKLVDRLEFSKANFSPEFLKGWAK